ncbi:MAG: ECF transporter S component [Clostridiales bacterium]|jgi:uncharacterized membrane protein|nr:ECF transporter S component [Clostridiales bacterium]
MSYSLTLKKTAIKTKTLITAVAIVSAVALPQLFHFVGIASGSGAALGTAFLPMHIPVILAALLAGPLFGIITGVLSPLVSFAISGMPAAVMLPYMIVELAGYGLVAGLLYKSKMPVFLKLLAVQIGGRLLRASAVLFAVYALDSQMMTVAQTWEVVLAGLPGILLQWAVIPLLAYRLKGFVKHYR